jgi:thiamine biosynthesis lipoprotein
MTEAKSHSFRTMGTDALVMGEDGRAGFGEVALRIERELAEVEARFSRFRPESELSRVNARAARWTRVSDPFAELLGLALEAARLTRGLFDPTVLPALRSAGYDRDFALVRAGPHPEPGPAEPCGRWQEVELAGNQVWIPPGVGLDFGGIAKGWAVDRAIELGRGLTWLLVSAGGDLRLAGSPPDGGLEIAIEDPLDRGGEVMRVRLESGALATSSVTSRTWGPRLHQIIDPRTGLPAITGILQATAWGDTCAEAEMRSKWALLAGPPALDLFPAVLVLEDDRVLLSLDPSALAEPA